LGRRWLALPALPWRKRNGAGRVRLLEPEGVDRQLRVVFRREEDLIGVDSELLRGDVHAR
jgi:hypothetical protein